MSNLNLELATMDEIVAEIKKRCSCFVLSAVLNKEHSTDIIETYIESNGKYYERLGMCADLQMAIYNEGLKEN